MDGISAFTPAGQQGASAIWRFSRVRVRVPATCANLGSGFDCLALAVERFNTFEVALLAPDDMREPSFELHGDPADVSLLHAEASSSSVESNVFLAAFAAACRRAGTPMPRLRIRADIAIPPSRGLGSSATAVVGGLVAANTLLGEPLTADDLLDLAVECEPGNHPDNVAAALLGGLVITGARDAARRLVTVSLPVPSDLRAVLFIPAQPMSTVAGRALLPDAYPRADVTHNLSRAALLVVALTGARYDLLGVAMQDRLHQPYRARIFPALEPMIEAALAAGAHGACLSGGGSSILALASESAARVAAALQSTANQLGVPGHAVELAVSPRGATATFDFPASGEPGVLQ